MSRFVLSPLVARMQRTSLARGRPHWRGICAGLLLAGLNAPVAQAQMALPEVSLQAALFQSPAYQQALLVALGEDALLQEFYRSRNYQPLWSGAADVARRRAVLQAFDRAADHGLPVGRYDAAALRQAFREAQTAGDLGRIEQRMSRAYLAFARDLSTGLLKPATVDATIVRQIPERDGLNDLRQIASQDPAAVLQALLPKGDAYVQLMRARFELEAAAASGNWGAVVPGKSLSPGATGAAVIALRDRLVAMGYLAANARASYDRALQAAVQSFQRRHGLPADGLANAQTLAQINMAPLARLTSVLVAMERERWMQDISRRGRMIWVNIPDLTAKILDDGMVSFSTRAVVGREEISRRTPEFSDLMDHMVVNPSWGVPRSIIVGEYLPLLKRNPNAVKHIQVVDSRGRVVSRGAVNFSAYSARSFPFSMRQPPGDANALGKVKFMFPNKHNIYLHDTPSKSLFANDRRAYSHGCIRLADPFDFAHALFLQQEPAIETEFNRVLKTGKETPVKLEKKVPIHLVYFTAYPEGKGRIGYRRDVYDRDAKLWAAMAEAGVVLPALSQ